MSEERRSSESTPVTHRANGVAPPAEIPRGLPLVGLAGGLLVGGIFWLVLRAVHPIFELPPEAQAIAMFPSADSIARHRAAVAQVDLRNTMVVTGMLGGLLAVALASGQVRLCRRAKVAVLGIVVSGLIAAGMGLLAGILGVAANRLANSAAAIPTSVAIVGTQGVLLGVMGGGVGLGLGALTGRVGTAARSAAHGLLAGALAGILFPILTAGLLPPANINMPIPGNRFAQLLWIGLACGLIGILTPRGLRPPARVTCGTTPGRTSETPSAAGEVTNP
jgi:hypothetical protein